MRKEITHRKLIKKFSIWYFSAKKHYEENNLDNFNAFSLATSSDNKPSSRMVLLKDFNEEGFTFYTNAESKKAQEFLKNSNVAMLFYWSLVKRQVRIEGQIKQINEEIAKEYFATRPFISKIGAWSSKQSRVMEGSNQLYLNVAKYTLKYKNNVPKPPYWQGFIIIPNYIEFWKEKDFRLHLRESYTKNKNGLWQKNILYP